MKESNLKSVAEASGSSTGTIASARLQHGAQRGFLNWGHFRGPEGPGRIWQLLTQQLRRPGH